MKDRPNEPKNEKQDDLAVAMRIRRCSMFCLLLLLLPCAEDAEVFAGTTVAGNYNR
ncbi:hypothetical protein LOAG_07305 [Loa loa]|uniref:Uncharacterized protein n=1 Tax=Loa loa TaxID=7209 RepID=A0A1S0TWU6_LOALO|nr:hypothetical protein LOAG_07305 [Loa loa]EFO21181.1 hypothetical protein LOAG_07305 [Loa loa]